ncbi:hypothetical protein SELMODRAFT_414374 [Selaginella moellendorffii]|uniref:Uncharacterized protein n=1 Tax=Selaginella moellendorffii TaxID=88036 RepID=D8RSJ1_SELML|nr:hypothetical protein SELMODRAFT_414374 [Selaginella moellendorffii]
MGINDGHGKSEYSVWEVGTPNNDVAVPEYAGGEWSPLQQGRKRGYRRVYVEPGPPLESTAPASHHHWDAAGVAAAVVPNKEKGEISSPADDETSVSDLSLISGLGSKNLRDLVLGHGGPGMRKLVYGDHGSAAGSRTSSIKSAAGASRFDHIGSLKMTYAAFKDPENEKEGVPLQLLPEILESSRFVVPTEDVLLAIIHKLDQRYDPGEPLKWDLLLHVAMHLERKDNSKSFFNSRTGPPFVWKSLQKSNLRKPDIEEFYPGLEPQVMTMMKDLEHHKKRCEREGNYVEARSTARRLNELKILENNKRRGAMLNRHMQERQSAERAYKAEVDDRNKYWDDKITLFQKDVMEHASRLKRQHTTILDTFRTKMASKKPCKPQWSAELLNQRKVQEYLGKQGKYSEALRVKKTADRLEHEELEATIESYQAEVGLKEQALRTKQHSEMEVLLQKATKGRDQLREGRAKDLQRIHQRHKNIVRELKALHAHEMFKFEQMYGKKMSEYQSNLGNGRYLSPPTRGYSSLALPKVAEVQCDDTHSTEGM